MIAPPIRKQFPFVFNALENKSNLANLNTKRDKGTKRYRPSLRPSKIHPGFIVSVTTKKARKLARRRVSTWLLTSAIRITMVYDRTGIK